MNDERRSAPRIQLREQRGVVVQMARDQMLQTGEGYDADDVRAYIQARIAGQNPQRPVLKKWRA